MTGPADLKGKKVRSAGPSSALVEAAGANVMSIAAGEIRDSISRGLIDCWAAFTLELATAYGLHEATPYLYDVGYGLYGTSILVVNETAWDEMPEAHREVIKSVSDEMLVDQQEIVAQKMDEACTQVLESGRSKLEGLSDAAQADWAKLVGTRVHDEFVESSQDADQFLVAYEESLKKFEQEYASYEDPLQACLQRS